MLRSALRGAAISAARFAEWLRTRWRHPHARLGSLEVYLSPIEADAAAAYASAGEVAGPADSEHVKTAVARWAERCNVDAADTALLYVAGHGTESLYGRGYLLLQDHGALGSGALGNALDLEHVRMAIATKRAHADFIFVDACRYTVDEQFDAADPGGLKPIDWKRSDEPQREHMKVFYGAAPGQSAYTLPKDDRHGTMFCKAVMAGLEGAAVDLDDQGNFCASANRLLEAIAQQIASEGAAAREQYALSIKTSSDGVGTFKDVPFHWPDRVPDKVQIELDPKTAAAEGTAALLQLKRAGLATGIRPVALLPHPSELELDSGKYRLRLESTPGPPTRFSQENDFVVMPSAQRWKVEVEYVEP